MKEAEDLETEQYSYQAHLLFLFLIDFNAPCYQGLVLPSLLTDCQFS